jgi:hypothetical protein
MDTDNTIRLELFLNKGEVITILDQPCDSHSDGTQISFLNYVNSSSHPGGD